FSLGRTASWVQPGRFRSEAAFAILAGASPIRLIRPNGPSPTQPRRRPPTQPSLAHDRALTPLDPSPDTRLHRPPHPRRQDDSRHQPLPQALPRPPPLPAPRAISDDLTTIEASKPNASSALCSPTGLTAPSTAHVP